MCQLLKPRELYTVLAFRIGEMDYNSDLQLFMFTKHEWFIFSYHIGNIL